jgi:outer membrane protein
MLPFIFRKNIFNYIIFSCLFTQSTLIFANNDDDKKNTNNWEVTLGISPLIVPEYEGADEYRVIPVPLIDIKYQDKYFFSPYKGLGAALINTEHWEAGPMITYRLWQNEDSNPALDGIGDIPGTFEGGGYVNYKLDRWRFGADVRQGLNGHRGAIVDFDIERAGTIGKKIAYSFGPNVAWVSKNYMDTYFGIDHTQSRRSGYDVYLPGAGFKDVGIGGSIYYLFAEHWSVAAFGKYARLVGDAADSPIVKETGSPNQVTVALSLAYKF